MKFLIWFVAGAAIVLWLLHVKKASIKSEVRHDENPRDGTEPMIRCAYCDMHVPVSESFADPSGASFCSEEHGRLGASRP